MNILDKVTTPDGEALVVGFPHLDTVEVKFPDNGGLRIYNRELVNEHKAQDVPLSKSGRPLSGAALAKHQAKQQGR